MRKILLLNTFFLLLSFFTQAQPPIQSSTSSNLTPYKFEAIQNEAVAFEVVIRSSVEIEWEEFAPFILYTNPNSNGLFIQDQELKGSFSIQLFDNQQKTILQKQALEEITLIDLSTLAKGTYKLLIETIEEPLYYTIILR